MKHGPYRVGSPRSERSLAPVDPEERLGLLRSRHTASRFPSPLAFFTLVLVLGIAGIVGARGGVAVVLLTIPSALLGSFVGVWPWLRALGTAIELHAHGIAIARRKKRVAVPFEDVDEVWYELSGHIITGLRLVEHGGRTHRVTLRVQGGVDVLNWVLRNCTDVLAADAMRALRQGATLTFGKVHVNDEVIEAEDWRHEWAEVKCVRLQPGRVVLVPRARVAVWRTISLADVPHPTLFVSAVRACKPNVEIDGLTHDSRG